MVNRPLTTKICDTPETIVEPEVQIEDLDLAVTLPAHALRYLFKHSEVHLNVEWRDLSDADWNKTVRAIDGETVAMRQTPLARAAFIWRGAQQLGVAPKVILPSELSGG